VNLQRLKARVSTLVSKLKNMLEIGKMVCTMGRELLKLWEAQDTRGLSARGRCMGMVYSNGRAWTRNMKGSGLWVRDRDLGE
jgi:hypothetical protein